MAEIRSVRRRRWNDSGQDGHRNQDLWQGITSAGDTAAFGGERFRVLATGVRPAIWGRYNLFCAIPAAIFQRDVENRLWRNDVEAGYFPQRRGDVRRRGADHGAVLSRRISDHVYGLRGARFIHERRESADEAGTRGI